MTRDRHQDSITRRDFVRRSAAGSLLAALPREAGAERFSFITGAPADQQLSFLDAAKSAARWIAASRIQNQHGVTWPAIPPKADTVGTGLYHGAPGVVLFLLELHAATKDSTYLAEAIASADHLVHQVKTVTDLPPGLYTGL